MKNQTFVALAACVVAFSGCGNVDSKPLEPVPNGGPGTAPNGSANASTNASTINAVANNAVANNNPNVPTNAETTCPGRPGPTPLGFEFQPSFETGFVTSVSDTELEILAADESESVTFVAEGLNLINYFGLNDEVSVTFVNEADSVLQRVAGQDGSVDFYASTAESDGQDVSVSIESADFSMSQLQAVDPVMCEVAGTCGLQDARIFRPQVDVVADEFSRVLDEGETELVEGGASFFEVHIHRSTQYNVDPIETDSCSAPGTASAELSFFFGVDPY
jgi:hypothetical protein